MEQKTKTAIGLAIERRNSRIEHLSKILEKHKKGELNLSLDGQLISHEIWVLKEENKEDKKLQANEEKGMLIEFGNEAQRTDFYVKFQDMEQAYNFKYGNND